jgi:DNA-binding FadR family transcriptional regulator
LTFPNVGDKVRLVDRVVGSIQNLIVKGQLEPEAKLPPERELAEQMGVSRTVIREAIRILVAKGLLDARPGIGTIVRKIDKNQISDSLGLFLQIHGEDAAIHHLHQVRNILETEIASLAANQATEKDVESLMKILEEMEQYQDQPEDFAEADNDFHQELAQTTHNPLLVVLLDSIRDLLHEVRLRVARFPGLSRRVMQDHHAILECILGHDAEGARRAMADHLRHAWRIQEESLVEDHVTKTPQ